MRNEDLVNLLDEAEHLYEEAGHEPCWCGDPEKEAYCPSCDKAIEASKKMDQVRQRLKNGQVELGLAGVLPSSVICDEVSGD